MENRKVIVVGAGIGGLSACYWLRQRGYEVEVLEATERPGGRMVTLERQGDRVDVGAQFYHSSFRHGMEMIDCAGLANSRRNIKGKVQYSLSDGSTYLYDHRVPYLKLLGLRGNLQLHKFILRYVVFGRRFPPFGVVRDIPEYDNVGVLDLYRSASNRRLRDYLVSTVCLGETAALPEWTSLYHYIRMFRSVMFADFFSLARGVSSLAEKLAKDLPVAYGSPVRQLVLEKDRVVGVQMEGDGSVRKAGHVVVAVTPPAAARMLPDELEEQRRFMDSVLYVPMAMPVFYLDRPLRQDVWCYFNDPGKIRPFMFAIDALAKVPDMCPSGKSALTAWPHYPDTLEMMKQTDEQVLKQAREDLEVMIPGFSKWIEEARVFRHAFVNAIYPPGAYRRVLDFQAGASRLRGVSFVSSALEGTSMEAAMMSGAAAVRRVCGWGGTA
jgi:protoporphyrinogen/coproporphyrinogen III oxidase